jgi:hypothetical protein
VTARALLLAGALLLSACAPKPAPPPADFRIDCALGYDALAARIAAIPEVKLARTPGEPYHYFNTADGHASYVVTLPGGAGHPAVIQQSASSDGLLQTGCSYGDRAGYDQLIAYLKSLAGARHP